MKNKFTAEKDERFIAVENAASSFGFKIALFAILLDVMYRSFWLNEAAWDLMGIVIFSSLSATIYQARHKVFTKTMMKYAVIILLAAAVVSAVIAFVAGEVF